MLGQLGWPTELDASLACPLDTDISARLDQRTFELGSTREQRCHQLAVRRRGIAPCVG